jgi:hypothetical protein
METQTKLDQENTGVDKHVMETGELLNGRIAMLGIIAALGAYALTGKIIPGIW